MIKYKFDLNNTSIETKGNELIVSVKENKQYRARVRGYYYYIDSTLQIVRCTENGGVKDTERWNKGNYFETLEGAKVILDKIIPIFDKKRYIE